MTSQLDLAAVAALVVERLGLAFPAERWSDLERAVRAAARERGGGEAAQFVEDLGAAATREACLARLAGHLTVGETYFCREQAGLRVLRSTILPTLLASRRRSCRQLRLWSAGCCTGEEPYTLAMVLTEELPDLADWQVTLLATDVNPHFVARAEAGVYGPWSFRGVPEEVRERYFTAHARGFAVAPHLRSLVTFARHNLVDELPALGGPADVIFCCNVLMYFAPAQAAQVVRALTAALAVGGWLVVSPVEAATGLFDALTRLPEAGGNVFRKPVPVAAGERPDEPQPVAVTPVPRPVGARAKRVEPVPAATRVTAEPPRAAAMVARARLLADQGQLAAAREWADQAMAADPLSAEACYLGATICLEQGDSVGAEASLRRTLYLHPEYLLAHVALAQLARAGGRTGVAARHAANALVLLDACEPTARLEEAEGLTAGRLAEALRAML